MVRVPLDGNDVVHLICGADSPDIMLLELQMASASTRHRQPEMCSSSMALS